MLICGIDPGATGALAFYDTGLKTVTALFQYEKLNHLRSTSISHQGVVHRYQISFDRIRIDGRIIIPEAAMED